MKGVQGGPDCGGADCDIEQHLVRTVSNAS